VRQIFPVTGQELDVVPAGGGAPLPQAVRELAALYGNEARPTTAGRPWLRANMISSVDGASALSGRSGGLGGPADRMIFTVLRSMADVVLVGGGTARAEHYRPAAQAEMWPELRADLGLAPAPPIAVVTASLDLDGCPRLLDSSPPTILITTAAARPERAAALDGRARIIRAGHDQVDVSQAVAALADLGYRQILAEGGPHLLGQLAEAGLVDELCLTISPMLAGGTAGRIVASSDEKAAATAFRLASILADNGFLMTRYVRSAD
jgi:riboflavin biosynthesis pyrimidine reductase